MSPLVFQELLVAAAGLILLLLAILLVRRGRLAIRYGLGWSAIAVGVILTAPLLGLIERLAGFLGLTPTGLILASVVAFLALLSLQLSISVSGSQEAIRTLSEANALLEERLRRAEREAPPAQPAEEQ